MPTANRRRAIVPYCFHVRAAPATEIPSWNRPPVCQTSSAHWLSYKWQIGTRGSSSIFSLLINNLGLQYVTYGSRNCPVCCRPNRCKHTPAYGHLYGCRSEEHTSELKS